MSSPTRTLSASATYADPGDHVTITAWLEDPSTSPALYKIADVAVGTVELVSSRGAIIATLSFDATHGNSDGGFHFSILHPTEYRDLLARVSVETFSGPKLRTEVPVVIERGPEIPLEGQPALGVNER